MDSIPALFSFNPIEYLRSMHSAEMQLNRAVKSRIDFQPKPIYDLNETASRGRKRMKATEKKG